MLRIYLLVVGTLLIVIGLLTGFRRLRARKRWKRATGHIIGSEIQHSRFDEPGPYYFPRIAFSIGEERELEFVSRVGSLKEPVLGQGVAVRFDPHRPDQAAEDTFAAQWGFPAGFFLIGAISLLAAGLGSWGS